MVARLLAFAILLISTVIHAIDIQSTSEISFVIRLNKNKECSFTLPPTATLMDMKQIISSKCGIHYPFAIKLDGELILLSDSSTNQTISDIPSITATQMMLAGIWMVATEFRIPLQIHRIPSKHDNEVFVSLFSMIGTADEGEWYQFIRQCVVSESEPSLSCSVQNLCDRFGDKFICDHGELTEIRLNHQKLHGVIDLSTIPLTVTLLNVERNSLTGIIGLDELQLAGKQLRNLNVRKNPLEIDLTSMVRSSLSLNNKLRVLWVTASQISRYLSAYPGCNNFQFRNMGERVHRGAEKWINLSILDKMMLGWNKCRKIQRSDAVMGST